MLARDPNTDKARDCTYPAGTTQAANRPIPVPAPAQLPIVIIPNLAGFLIRIPDGSRKPPTVYLTTAQLTALRDTIAALLDGPTRLTDATPPGEHSLSAYALGF